MPKPCVSYTNAMIPAKIIKLEVIVICIQIFFGIRYTMRSDNMGATCSSCAGPRVYTHKYDLSVHLITVRKGLTEGCVEVQPILG